MQLIGGPVRVSQRVEASPVHGSPTTAVRTHVEPHLWRCHLCPSAHRHGVLAVIALRRLLIGCKHRTGRSRTSLAARQETAMDSERFDRISSIFAEKQSRRDALRALAMATLGAGGLVVLGSDHTASEEEAEEEGRLQPRVHAWREHRWGHRRGDTRRRRWWHQWRREPRGPLWRTGRHLQRRSDPLRHDGHRCHLRL